MTDPYPSLRPMGDFSSDVLELETKPAPSEALMPWIDIHGHHHTLSWNDHVEFELTGCQVIVMTGGLASEYPYRPTSAADIQNGWDQSIRTSHSIERSHFIEAYATVGVHTSVGPVEGLERLLDLIPEYAGLDEVVAISETGITMVQEHETVPLSDQREIVRSQLHIAREAGLPAVLHTPTLSKGDAAYATVSVEAHDQGEPTLDAGSAKLDAVQIDIELAREVGIPEERIVFTHGHRSMASWVLENTDSYVSFTIGNATRDINAADVARAIDRYGPERILIDSDSAHHKELHPFAVKRAMLDLLRMGIEPSAVRAVVYENQRRILGFDHLPS